MKHEVVLQEALFGEDKLILEYKEQVEYAGYEPADVFEVYYLERAPYLDEDSHLHASKAYNIVNTEIFIVEDFRTAFKHFMLRKQSKNPASKVPRRYWHPSMLLKPKQKQGSDYNKD